MRAGRILNLGLNDEVVEGLSRKTGRPRFAWDSYRRFVQMYGDVVLGMKPVNKEDIDPFEEIIEKVKEEKGVKLDNELEVEDLKNGFASVVSRNPIVAVVLPLRSRLPGTPCWIVRSIARLPRLLHPDSSACGWG